MFGRRKRIHDWRKLKWPFIVTFLYYSLLHLATGLAQTGSFDEAVASFAEVLMTVLLVDAVAYTGYIFFLSRTQEDMQKLWLVFVLAYSLASYDDLMIIWHKMEEMASAVL